MDVTHSKAGAPSQALSDIGKANVKGEFLSLIQTGSSIHSTHSERNESDANLNAYRDRNVEDATFRKWRSVESLHAREDNPHFDPLFSGHGRQPQRHTERIKEGTKSWLQSNQIS
jgi:hypothetical protein